MSRHRDPQGQEDSPTPSPGHSGSTGRGSGAFGGEGQEERIKLPRKKERLQEIGKREGGKVSVGGAGVKESDFRGGSRAGWFSWN